MNKVLEEVAKVFATKDDEEESSSLSVRDSDKIN